MSTNPTPTAKPTPAELAEKLTEGCLLVPKRWSGDCGEMSRVDEAGTDALMAKAAATIRELSEQLQNARNLGLEWCNDANGHIALCGDQLNAALSRTPDAP